MENNLTRPIVTAGQFLTLARSLRRSANGMGEVVSIKGRIYYFGTELETLSLLKAHRFNKLADQGYSANRKSSFFAIEFAGIEFDRDFSVGFNSAEVTESV